MDATKSGTRTSASGSVTSKTAKSAVKSALDSAAATMQTPAGLDDVDDKSKGAGNKRPRQGNTPKPAKEKTQHEKDLKRSKRTSSRFSIKIVYTVFLQLLYFCLCLNILKEGLKLSNLLQPGCVTKVAKQMILQWRSRRWAFRTKRQNLI